jgi:hypothetical protein
MTVLRTTVLVVVVAALLAMPAFAQTPRQDATGAGFGGVSVDETASFNNPAGLPMLQTFGTNVSPWPSRASINALVDGPDDLDQYSAFYAGRAADNSKGWGAGYLRSENSFEVDAFSLGYGQMVGDNLSVGASLFHSSIDSATSSIDSATTPATATAPMTTDDDATSFDLAAMYRKEVALNTWRFGLWFEDIADEYGGPFVHVGAGVELPAGVDVAATLYDVSDEADSFLGIGAEWEVPMSQAIVRAGNVDGDFTAGLGYQWTNFEISASWVEADPDDLISLGVTGCF